MRSLVGGDPRVPGVLKGPRFGLLHSRISGYRLSGVVCKRASLMFGNALVRWSDLLEGSSKLGRKAQRSEQRAKRDLCCEERGSHNREDY
jgi:hypothetical protein